MAKEVDEAAAAATAPRRKREPGPLINVVPGSLPRATPKQYTNAHAVQVPKDLADRDARSTFAALLYGSGVVDGVTFGKSGLDVLVSIDGHRAVRLQPEQWLVISPGGMARMDHDEFTAQFDLGISEQT